MFAGLLVLLIGATGSNAVAQEKYPDRSIRLVVPFSAGGGTDLMGRRLSARMTSLLGQQMIVDNKTGAGGNIGAAEVARAKPDGYTLLLGTSSTHVINPLTENVPFDPVKSFAPITVLGIGTYLIAVHPTVATSLQDLIKRVKASPGKYSYASVNGMAQFSGELFKKQAGALDMVYVPYRGSAQSQQDVIAGQIPIVVTVVSAALAQHRAGKLRILAVFGEKRSSGAPDIPTAIELGVPGMSAYTINVLFAPAGTPRPIIDQLHQTSMKVVADEAFQKELERVGTDPVLDSSPERAVELVKRELAKWAPIVKTTSTP